LRITVTSNLCSAFLLLHPPGVRGAQNSQPLRITVTSNLCSAFLLLHPPGVRGAQITE